MSGRSPRSAASAPCASSPTSRLKRISITGGNLEDFLGVRKFLPEANVTTDQVGLVTGLAWTAVGGTTLEVEVNVVDGTGKLELTGNLGDVMKQNPPLRP